MNGAYKGWMGGRGGWWRRVGAELYVPFIRTVFRVVSYGSISATYRPRQA